MRGPVALLSGALALLTAPPAIAHEVTHAAVAVPWADKVYVRGVTRFHGAAVLFDWPDDVPWWAPVLASLAPFLAGCVGGVVALWLFVSSGLDPPTTAMRVAQWSIIAAWWSVFAIPSRADLATANDHIRGKNA